MCIRDRLESEIHHIIFDVRREKNPCSMCAKMRRGALHNAMKELAEKARDKRLAGDDQSGGTFTISNVGMFPIDWSTPIINPPQVAIIGFGRSVKKMAVVDDQPAIRSMMNMFLTFDHRVFDGLEVGRILSDLKELVENPELITV